jgi:hypothetical protein
MTGNGRATAGPSAAERGNGPVASVEAKVIGPILLAKHFAPLIAEKGSLLFFTGLAARRPSPEGVAMAVTNGGVSMLASALRSNRRPRASAPSRPPSSPPSAWDAAVPGKQQLFRRVAATASARHVEDAPTSQPPPAR